jgi:solute carrier family 25 phosphate transporter 3
MRTHDEIRNLSEFLKKPSITFTVSLDLLPIRFSPLLFELTTARPNVSFTMPSNTDITDITDITSKPPTTAPKNNLLLKDPITGFRPLEYYSRCMVGGFAACGFTHAAVVTLDVAKVRAQAYSKAGKWPSGLFASIQRIWQVEGIAGLTKGVVPTFWGYGAQGLFKFGLNEFFKDYYTKLIGGEEQVNASTWTKMSLWAAASGSAEVFADVALCPFEMTKVKMQVTLPGQTDGIPKSMIPAMRDMSKRAVDTKFPFGSLYPLWGRQVPYTMIKFVGFYQTQELVYQQMDERLGKTKSEFSTAEQLGITFACGYWAGIFCAIATQPMDNLVSMKGIAENQNKSWGTMASEMGTHDLFLKGLSTRIIMIGTLTGLQWWIYGSFKNAFGLGTS